MRGKDFNTGLRGVLFEARHYQRMGAAVWLYGWLVLRQTHQQGGVGWVLGGAPVSYREIEEETGFNPRTLERWMQVLRRERYVYTEAVPAGLVICILKAKKFPQGARKSADGVRKVAEARTQNRGATQSYPSLFESIAPEIRSSSIERSQDNQYPQDIPFLHRDFHNGTVSMEDAAHLSNPNPSHVTESQNSQPRAPGPPFRRDGRSQTEQGTVPDARLLRQLIRREREEAVRRELAVGTGPEVRRS